MNSTVNEFISIPEAVQISGKSESSIRRLVKRLVKVNSSEIKKISTPQGHNWLIKKGYLKKDQNIRDDYKDLEYEATSQTPSQNRKMTSRNYIRSDQSKRHQNNTEDIKKHHVTSQNHPPPSQTPSHIEEETAKTSHVGLLIETLREQLVVKDKQIEEKDHQIREKDKHIKDLVTRQGETNLLLHNFQVQLLDRGEDENNTAEEPIRVDSPTPKKTAKTQRKKQKNSSKSKAKTTKKKAQKHKSDTKSGFLGWLLGE